jgi:hypothetical protein
MKLTIEEDREALKRYAHLKRAGRPRAPDARPCLSMCPGTVRTCALERGHGGPHVAHGVFRRVVAVWDVAAEPRRSKPGAWREKVMRYRPRQPAPRLVRILEAVRDRFLALGTSLETVLFLVMFIAFAGFAIHWFLLFTGWIR